MTAEAALFSIKMKGEKHTYSFRGSEQHALTETAKTISDMTGWKAEYLTKSVLRKLRIGEEHVISPAGQGGFGGTPTFIVKRVS